MNMKMRNIIAVLSMLLLPLSMVGQMYVWKDGRIIYMMDKGIADSITFEKPYDPLKEYAFSVGVGKQVRFSKGNLQYCDLYYEWRFAENQYDIIGGMNSKIGDYDNEVWIDLFGWGTFGACFNLDNGKDECHVATEASTDYRDYLINGLWSNDLYTPKYISDWGFWNSKYILNGNKEQWRTLSGEEWNYLLTGRADAARKFALATVNGRSGLVVLADDFQMPDDISFVPAVDDNVTFDKGLYVDDGFVDDHFLSNCYNVEQWRILESAGALFLPVTGRRWGYEVRNQNWGFYWSTSVGAQEREGNCIALSFYMSGVTPMQETSRAYGCSVRLVQDIKDKQ